MDELTRKKHEYEQAAYRELRDAMVDDFLTEPEKFVAHFGKRPEDLSGHDLREHYPHFLVQQRKVSSRDEGFRKRFLEGRIF